MDDKPVEGATSGSRFLDEYCVGKPCAAIANGHLIGRSCAEALGRHSPLSDGHEAVTLAVDHSSSGLASFATVSAVWLLCRPESGAVDRVQPSRSRGSSRFGPMWRFEMSRGVMGGRHARIVLARHSQFGLGVLATLDGCAHHAGHYPIQPLPSLYLQQYLSISKASLWTACVEDRGLGNDPSRGFAQWHRPHCGRAPMFTLPCGRCAVL